MNIFLDPPAKSSGFTWQYKVDNQLLPAVEHVDSGSLTLILCTPDTPTRFIEAHQQRLIDALQARKATCSVYEGYGVTEADVLALRPQLREIRTLAQEQGTLAIYYLHQRIRNPDDRRRYDRADSMVLRHLNHEADLCFSIQCDGLGPYIQLTRANRTELTVTTTQIARLSD